MKNISSILTVAILLGSPIAAQSAVNCVDSPQAGYGYLVTCTSPNMDGGSYSFYCSSSTAAIEMVEDVEWASSGYDNCGIAQTGLVTSPVGGTVGGDEKVKTIIDAPALMHGDSKR